MSTNTITTNHRVKMQKYSRITDDKASLEPLRYCRSKFPGLEKKSRKRGISSPTSTNSVWSSSAVKRRWCFRSFSAKISKSLATRRGEFASFSSSESAILPSYLSPCGAATKLPSSLQMPWSSSFISKLCVTQRKQDNFVDNFIFPTNVLE